VRCSLLFSFKRLARRESLQRGGDPLRLHGLEASRGVDYRKPQRLRSNAQPGGVGEDQRWTGQFLSKSARNDRRIPCRRDASPEHNRTGPAWPQPIKRLALRGGEHLQSGPHERPACSSDRQTSRDGCRRDKGLYSPKRDRSRYLLRLRHDDPRGRTGWASRCGSQQFHPAGFAR
jgi:hypothetical protein